MSETRIEWGAELSWPDGHSEVRTATDRRDAEFTAWNETRSGSKLPDVTARPVQRTVVIGKWEPVGQSEDGPETTLDGWPGGDPVDLLWNTLHAVAPENGSWRPTTGTDLYTTNPFRPVPWFDNALKSLTDRRGNGVRGGVHLEVDSPGIYRVRRALTLGV